MRITNSMTRNNVLWSINRTEERLDFYQTQMATGKKIQRPSEDPIVAVRALKFRTNVREVAQYKTNSEDAISWLNINEQSLTNTNSMLKRVRDLAVQGSSDNFNLSDLESMLAEIEQIKTQVVNEANVSYAGRYVFSGYKTETPMVFSDKPDSADTNYEITEHFTTDDVDEMSMAFDEVAPNPPSIDDVYRLRLGYGDIESGKLKLLDEDSAVLQPAQDAYETAVSAAYDAYETSIESGVPKATAEATLTASLTTAETDYDAAIASADLTNNGFVVNYMSSTDVDAYKPTATNVINVLEDTGEIIFHEDHFNGTTPAPVPAIPENLEIAYDKSEFEKYDMVPENYFETIHRKAVPDKMAFYDKVVDEMEYQISYNQELVVNTMGHQVFTSDLIRDIEELIRAAHNIDQVEDMNFGPEDTLTDAEKEQKEKAEIFESLQKDVLGNVFNEMIGKLDGHIDTVLKEEAIIGSKVNRLDLTINRLADDKNNFTELLSKNEDVDMTEAVLNLQAQEIVYNAALASSSKIMQQSLLDFLR